MELTKTERLIISNQLKILKSLYPEEADGYEEQITALESGYELHYDGIVEHIEDGLSEKECREILDILNMYRAMHFSHQRMKDEGIEIDEDVEREIEFLGFDGNNESSRMGYVRYFIFELGRFSELVGGSKFVDFNSHGAMTLENYQRMLGVWRGQENRQDLNQEQLKEIIDASIHPDMRAENERD